MAALALIAIYASMRIAEQLGGSEAMLLCGVLAALFPPSIVYGSRCMTEMASAPLCTLAVLLVLARLPWKLVLAGCLAGIAIFLRYQNGLIAAGLLLWLIMHQRRSDAFAYTCGALVVGLAGGFLDLFTWGAPFHSFVTYIRFNLVEGGSAAFGIESLDYYVATFWSATGLAILPVTIGLVVSARYAPGLLGLVVVYFAAHTAIGHKELRFMMPMVPLALALSSVGLVRLSEYVFGSAKVPVVPTRRDRRTNDRRNDDRASLAQSRARSSTTAIAIIVGAAMVWRTVQATFDDFGQRNGLFSGPQSVWHAAENVNRLLWLAGEQADICGLLLAGYGPIWTGGYTYLHRDVPILWVPPLDDQQGNYVLARSDVDLPESYTTLATIGDAKLARRAGSCSAPPATYSRLFPKVG
jgi:hypothetical protein